MHDSSQGRETVLPRPRWPARISSGSPCLASFAAANPRAQVKQKAMQHAS